MKGCIVLNVRLKPGKEKAFVQAYLKIHNEVAKMKGYICDRVCQAKDDPLSWVIVSEWASLEDFLEWEHSPGHPQMVSPLRECWEETKGRQYIIMAETGKPS